MFYRYLLSWPGLICHLRSLTRWVGSLLSCYLTHLWDTDLGMCVLTRPCLSPSCLSHCDFVCCVFGWGAPLLPVFSSFLQTVVEGRSGLLSLCHSDPATCRCFFWRSVFLPPLMALHDLKQLCSQHLILGVSFPPSFRPVIFWNFFYIYVFPWFKGLIGFWWLCILSYKFHKYRVFIMCCELYWFVQKVHSGFSLWCHRKTQKNFLANPILNNLQEIASVTSFKVFLKVKEKLLVSQSRPTVCNQPTRLLCPWNSPGKNTGVGCHSHLRVIFTTQGPNPHLLHYKQILYNPSHWEAEGLHR